MTTLPCCHVDASVRFYHKQTVPCTSSEKSLQSQLMFVKGVERSPFFFSSFRLSVFLSNTAENCCLANSRPVFSRTVCKQGTGGVVERRPVTSHVSGESTNGLGAKRTALGANTWPPEGDTAGAAWALLEASEGQLATARMLLRTATTLDRSHGPAWLAWARLEWKEGNFEEAQTLFEKGTEIPGKDAASVLQAWASVEAEAKNENKARELFRRAAHRDPSLPFTWLQWGRLERSQGNLDDASELFRSGLRVDPTNVHLQHALGMLEKDRGNFQEARRVLTTAMEGAPENSHILGTLAEVEGATGAITKARTLAQEAVKSSHSTGGTAILYEKMANIEANSDRPEVARYIFAEAATAAPNDARILRSWALYEKAMGKAKEASELFRRSAKADPNLSRTWLQWGLWEMEIGNLLKARAVFDRGLEFNPESPHLFLAWAKMEQREKDFVMARELYQAGCNACPKYGPLWAAWGTMEWEVWKGMEGEREQKERLMQGEREGGKVKESRGGRWVETESRGSEKVGSSNAIAEESSVEWRKREDDGRAYDANREERHNNEDKKWPLIESDSMGVCSEMTSEVVTTRDLEVSDTRQIGVPELVWVSGGGERLPQGEVDREVVDEGLEAVSSIRRTTENEVFIEKRPWEQPEERDIEREVNIQESLRLQSNQEDKSSSVINGYSTVNSSELEETSEDDKFWDKKKRFRANQERHLAVNGLKRADKIFSEGAEKAAHYPPLFQRWKKMLYSVGNRRKAVKICQLARRQDADPYNKVPNIIQSAFQKNRRRRNWSGWENVNGTNVESVESLEKVAKSVSLESDDEGRMENLGQGEVKGSKAMSANSTEVKNRSKWRMEYMGERRWKGTSERGSWKGNRMLRQIKECEEEKKIGDVGRLYF